MIKYQSLVVCVMNMDRYIIDLLGMDSYVKGRRYYSWYVDLNDEGKSKEGYYFKFSVESERTYRHYNVKIDIKDYEIVSYSCNCEQFKEPEENEEEKIVFINIVKRLLVNLLIL